MTARPVFRRAPALGIAAVLLAAHATNAAEEWVATSGELGRVSSRLALHIGANWGVLSGSEVEEVDPGPGFEGGVSYRVLGNLSLHGAYARNSADLGGQVMQLLDQALRSDGRSATVVGTVDTSRLRLGVRMDAYREKNWRFRPYLVAAVLFSKTDVTIDSVDRISPPKPVPGPPPDFANVDISSFSSDQIGGMARFGVEYPVTRQIRVDLNAAYEVIEFPSGTNAITTFNTGLTIRL